MTEWVEVPEEDPSLIDLSKISVYDPASLTDEELETGGPWVPATHQHLLVARGWVRCPLELDGVDHPCLYGIQPPEEEVEALAVALGVNRESVRKALIELEHNRLEGDQHDPGDGDDIDQ